MLSRIRLRQLEADVTAVGDLVAAAPILGDACGVAHVHPFLAGDVGAVVPRIAARMHQNCRRHKGCGVLDPLLLRLRQRVDGAVTVALQVGDAVVSQYL